MRKNAPVPRGLVLVTALASCILLSADASADFVTVRLQTSEGVPIAGHTVTMYLESTNEVITTQITDAAGDCTLTDNVFGSGHNRCIGIAPKPGYVFSINGAMPVCRGGWNSVNFTYLAYRANIGSAAVVGGANGYVNPSRGETAKIIVTPGERGNLEVNIYTARGRLVVSKSRFAEVRVQNVIEWDGRNAAGQIVPSGIYTAQITGALTMRVKIAIVNK